MSDSSYRLLLEVPAVADYLELRRLAGLSAFLPEAAARGLKGTLHAVVVRKDEHIVGMGRLVGDGGCFVQVVDVAVAPAHQGRGLGKRIMAASCNTCTTSCPNRSS